MGILTRPRASACLHVAIAVMLLGVPLAGELRADDDEEDEDEHEHGDRHEHGDEHEDEDEIVPPATSPIYREACAECHLVYPPGLLPSRSWRTILERSGDHFEVELPLEADERRKIGAYLEANAAEKQRNEISRKILKSLGGKTPVRITDVPYLKKKHRKIKPAVFERESVGGRSSCDSCHKKAEEGEFDDDNVKIPKK